MKQIAVIHREGNGFVAMCPELDIRALELFFECAAPTEIQDRLGEEVFSTQVEAAGA